MEANDTIMSKDYMKTLILAKHCSPETNARDIVITDIEQDLVNEQAELSFKAGYEKGVEFLDLTSETQYKAGIKEVINFISSPCIKHKEAIGYPSRLNCPICWRTKLKEWQV